jgi:D-glycero-D-manno-heptose 1,7-bisphosphate phosphatase
MRKDVLIGLDRDDTLIMNPDEDFGKQDNWRDLLSLSPGVIEGLRLLNSYDVGLVVASNQSGVARGLFSAERQYDVNRVVEELLAAHGAYVHSWQISPYYSQTAARERGLAQNPWIIPDDDPRVGMRKPRIGMLERGAEQLGMTIASCSFVGFMGDQYTDVKTGVNAGGIGILVQTDKNADQVDRVNRYSGREFVVESFVRGAELMVSLIPRDPRNSGSAGR